MLMVTLQQFVGGRFQDNGSVPEAIGKCLVQERQLEVVRVVQKVLSAEAV
jgi:hypothetical protein